MMRPAMSSMALMLIAIAMIWFSRSASTDVDGRSLMVLGAAGLSGPLEKLADQFHQETGIPVSVTYRGSGELLAQYKISQWGDVLIAADTDYHREFVNSDICSPPVTIGHQYPCLIAASGSPVLSKAASLDEILQQNFRWSVPKPVHAAVGRKVKTLIGEEKFDQLLNNAGVTRETVSQVATDVRSGNAEIGIAWNTTVDQYRGIREIAIVGWKSAPSRIGVSVFSQSPNQAAAFQFATFCQQHGLALSFEHHQPSISP